MHLKSTSSILTKPKKQTLETLERMKMEMKFSQTNCEIKQAVKIQAL